MLTALTDLLKIPVTGMTCLVSAMPKPPADHAQMLLRKIFMGEFLEVWKKEYLARYWLNEMRQKTSSLLVQSMTGRLVEMCDCNLKRLDMFLPGICESLQGAAAIRSSVCEFPNRYTCPYHHVGDLQEIYIQFALLSLLQDSWRTFFSLAREAEKLYGSIERGVLEQISSDYKTALIICIRPWKLKKARVTTPRLVNYKPCPTTNLNHPSTLTGS